MGGRFRKNFGWEGLAVGLIAVSVVAAGYGMIGDMAGDKTGTWTEIEVRKWARGDRQAEAALSVLRGVAGGLEAKHAECWYAVVDGYRLAGSVSPERAAVQGLSDIWDFHIEGGQTIVCSCLQLAEIGRPVSRLLEAQRRERRAEVNEIRLRGASF